MLLVPRRRSISVPVPERNALARPTAGGVRIYKYWRRRGQQPVIDPLGLKPKFTPSAEPHGPEMASGNGGVDGSTAAARSRGGLGNG
jgi:hypothetical protein